MMPTSKRESRLPFRLPCLLCLLLLTGPGVAAAEGSPPDLVFPEASMDGMEAAREAATKQAEAHVATTRRQYDQVTAMMKMQLAHGGCCGQAVEQAAGYRGMLYDVKIVVQGPPPAAPEPPALAVDEFVFLSGCYSEVEECRAEPEAIGRRLFPGGYALLPADQATADTVDRPRAIPLGQLVGRTYQVDRAVAECRLDGIGVYGHRDRYRLTNGRHQAQVITGGSINRGELDLADLLLTGGLRMGRGWSELGLSPKGRELFPAPAGPETRQVGGGELLVVNERSGREFARKVGRYEVTIQDKDEIRTITQYATCDTKTQPNLIPNFPGAAGARLVGGGSCPYYDTPFYSQRLTLAVPAFDLYRLTGIKLVQGYGPTAEEIPTDETIDIFAEQWSAGGHSGLKDWGVMAELDGAPPEALGDDRRIDFTKLAIRTTGEIDSGLLPVKGFKPGRATAEIALAVPGTEAVAPLKLNFTLNRPEVLMETVKGGISSGEGHAVRLAGLVADLNKYQVRWQARDNTPVAGGLIGIQLTSNGDTEAVITPAIKASATAGQLLPLLKDANGPRVQVVAEVQDRHGDTVGSAAFKEVRLRPTVTEVVLKALADGASAAPRDAGYDLFLTADKQGARLSASLKIDGQALPAAPLQAMTGFLSLQQDSSHKLAKNDLGLVWAAPDATPGTAKVRAMIADTAAVATPGASPVFSEPLELTINRPFLIDQSGQGARLFIKGPAVMSAYTAVWLLSDGSRVSAPFAWEEGTWSSGVALAAGQGVARVEIYHQGKERVATLDGSNTTRIAPVIALTAPDPFIPGETVTAEAVITGIDGQTLANLYCRWSSDAGEVLVRESALKQEESGPAYCATAIRLDNPAPTASGAVSMQLRMRGRVFVALEKVQP